MKTKIALYFIALVALGIYLFAANKKCMRFFVEEWTNDKRPALLESDKYKYGDLYGMSYLSDYRADSATSGKYFIDEPLKTDRVEGNLWIIGDSFLEEMYKNPERDLYHTEVKAFLRFGLTRNVSMVAKLDPAKKNILLIEVSERLFRTRFTSGRETKEVISAYTLQPPAKNEKGGTGVTSYRIIPATIEQNLETVLFGYELFGGIKSAKADFFYNTFERSNPNVYVSPQQGRLFAAVSVDTFELSSSFKHLPDADITVMRNNLESIAAHYLGMGFDHVVISIIPNAATVCTPAGFTYNRLIPRMQTVDTASFGWLDIYNPMKKNGDPCSLYWKSDTHWNRSGFLLWESEFNAYLENYYAGARQEK
jgi:hypothetical protein